LRYNQQIAPKQTMKPPMIGGFIVCFDDFEEASDHQLISTPLGNQRCLEASEEFSSAHTKFQLVHFTWPSRKATLTPLKWRETT
jgi:hypothetical protein